MGDYVGTLIYTAWSTGGGHYVCLVRRPEGIFEVDSLDRRRHQKPATPQRIAASMGSANSLCWNVFSTSRRGNRGREVSPRKRRRTATDPPEAATGRQTATPDQETAPEGPQRDPAKAGSNDWNSLMQYCSRRTEECGAAPTVDQLKQFLSQISSKIHNLCAPARITFLGNKSRGQARSDEEQETTQGARTKSSHEEQETTLGARNNTGRAKTATRNKEQHRAHEQETT